MHLAQRVFRVTTPLAGVLSLAFALSGAARAASLSPLGPAIAPGGTTHSVVTSTEGVILPVDPSTVPCDQVASFEDVLGGESPGTNYDGLLWSGGVEFAERFMGQTLGFSGDFDVVSGTPGNPLILQVGAPGQNLDVFTNVTNVLTGLGNLGYPDLDAIGEGAIAMDFPTAQSRVSFELVGGNGGSATLSFYRADGTLLDTILITGLGDLGYGFATADGSASISGILIQNTDPGGIGVDNVCHAGTVVSSHSLTWGVVRRMYH